MKRLLAFDLGASNGRAILGILDGDRMELKELHRFDNHFVKMNGVCYWNLPHLYQELLEGFRAYQKLGIGELDCFGIDTWGVDYGLLDENGHILGLPRAYRMADDTDFDRVRQVIDPKTHFQRTGIAALNFNTVYQLARRKEEGDTSLAQARTLLLMPDLLGYFLTGEAKSEYTNVTTTMLFRPTEKDWDWESIRQLKLPEHLFTQIDYPGAVRGKLRQDLAAELGLNQAAFAAVGTHDTASAVAAIPGSGNFAFCSSGTWSLFGVETDQPVLTSQVYHSGFSNEGTVQGGFRPLKNIMGLWLIQECRRDWARTMGHALSWDEIVERAKAAEPLRTIIDPDYGAFFAGGGMVEKIQMYCRRVGQPIPDTVGRMARCIYESLALKYRWALEQLEQIKGTSIETLNIVGGGCKNQLLNQMAADATGRTVFAGPEEGAALGNLLMQAKALGEIHTIEQGRQIVRNSHPIRTYLPNHTVQWEAAYQQLLGQMKTEGSAEQ